MSENILESDEITECPVCGEKLSELQEERDAHVNGHLDQSEEAESLALARDLEAGVPIPPESQSGSTSSDRIGIPPLNGDGIENGEICEEQMIRGRELSDESYARTVGAYEDGHGMKLGESVSDSAEHYFEAIIEYISGLFEIHDLSLLEPRRPHLCSYMDLFCSNLAGVGWDCGYRNIQMMLSSLLSNEQYATLLSLSGVKEVPSLPEIAGRLEKLLGNGNETGLEEGVNGVLTETKVWIGASEAVDLLRELQVSAYVKDFETPTNNERSDMFEWIFQRYETWCAERFCGLHKCHRRSNKDGTPILDALVAPMYCQWQGHSVTIIGAEKSWAGEVSLLIVDPSRGFYESVTDRRRPLSPQLFRRTVRHAQMQHPRFQIVYVNQVQALVSSAPVPPKARARPPMWQRLRRKNDQPGTSSSSGSRASPQEAPSQLPTSNSQSAGTASRLKSKLRRTSEPNMDPIARSQSRPGRRELFRF